MLAIAILAAGKGTRMKSHLPKVLQAIGGASLINRVLESCNGLNPERLLLIVGHKAEVIKEELKHHSTIEFISQTPQNGTGHAVQQLIPVLKDFQGELLVLNGDVPLLRKQTINELVTQHRKLKAGVTFLTAKLTNPKGYGRVFADEQSNVREIIEDRDCNLQQSKNTLTNAGIYCFNWSQLKDILPKLANNNDQKELYLTDTVKMFNKAIHVEVDDINEVRGVNDHNELANCEVLLQKRLREYWISNGVTFIDKTSCTISELCKFGKDVVIEPQTHLRGNCNIGDGCRIGPGTLIENSDLGKNVRVIFSVVNDVKLGNNVEIGPYSHLRPQSIINDNCKIGNFVEVKSSYLGEKTKINHLSYIGDSKLGKEVNVGAGTVTANYDGKQKHRTVIGDYSSTGANSVLVAPINLGTGVTVGAGSTLTKDVPESSLAIGRTKQFIKRGWRKSKAQ